MRLATLDNGTRDGLLIVVDRTGERYADASSIAGTLQAALDRWEECEPRLRALAESLETESSVRKAAGALDVRRLKAPLPRAYEWVDGSAFMSHVRLVRKARGADLPTALLDDPLVYQGGSGVLLGPTDPIRLPNPAWGLDLEGEICVILKDVKEQTTIREAESRVALALLANDLTLRNLVPKELEKGFGFFSSKPATAFSPFAVTLDELGSAWSQGRVHLPLRCFVNDTLIGTPHAGEMHFSFFDLIAHISRTRAFVAGTLLGSGTVSSADASRGVACLAEQRARETIEKGRTVTEYLKPGDRIRIEMLDGTGQNLFGSIAQEVVA